MKGKGNVVLRASVAALFTAAIFFSAGCMSWEEGWKSIEKPSAKGDVKALLAKAAEQVRVADSKEKVLEFLKTYESVLKIDPENFEALVNLGDYTFFVGYAYTADLKEKDAFYVKTLRYCERAMYTNAEFRKLADKGEPVWEASRALSKKEMGAMYYWYLSAGNRWNDCLGAIGKLINFSWSGRTKRLLERMTAIDPDWYNGNIHFCWAAYYTIAPGFMGGDLKKAVEYYDRAIKAGPDNINYQYVRARYFRTKMKDREGFTKDLNYVIARDPKKLNYSYPWAVFYQKQAKVMLADIDKYMK